MFKEWLKKRMDSGMGMPCPPGPIGPPPMLPPTGLGTFPMVIGVYSSKSDKPSKSKKECKHGKRKDGKCRKRPKKSD